jgi:hypothetical protein
VEFPSGSEESANVEGGAVEAGTAAVERREQRVAALFVETLEKEKTLADECGFSGATRTTRRA